MQLQKELRTHNPPKDSTHVHYSQPNMNFKLQLEVVEPEFMYFLAYSAQFLDDL